MIDAHVHFWQPALGHDILIVRREARLQRDFLPADLEPLLGAAGIDRAVVIQSAPEHAETEYQLRLSAGLPWIAGVIGWVDPAAPDLVATLDEFQRAPKFRGVRLMLHRIADPEWIAGPAAGDGLAELARRDLAVDLIARSEHLVACTRALARVPTLRVVVDHGGGPPIAARGWEPWASRIAELARSTGACCKFSGLLEEGRPGDGAVELERYAAHLLACFGEERLVYASNWPVCDLVGGLAHWHAIARDLAMRLRIDPGRLFEINARHVYALDP